MSTSRQQNEACEKRYYNNTQIRDNRSKALKSGNWREVDDRQRIVHRVIRTGDSSLIAEVMANPQAPVLERIIGDRELMPASFFYDGARRMRTVGRIRIRSQRGNGFGTGFMISPRLLLTNNHVLESEATAATSDIQFDFHERVPGQLSRAVVFGFEPNVFFITNEDLDFTLVAIEETNDQNLNVSSRGWNPLIPQSGKAIVGDRVNIVQHPNGRPQEVSVRQNRVVDVVGDFLHYSTDTEAGSSGSPVFNDQWDVAALHHAAVPKRDANGQFIGWVANEGVRISRIIEFLDTAIEQESPGRRELYSQIQDAPPVAPDSPENFGSQPNGGTRQHSAYVSERGDLIIPTPAYIATVFPDIKLPIARADIKSSQNLRTNVIDVPSNEPTDSNRQARLRQLAESMLEDFSERPYFDAAENHAEKEEYYSGVPTSVGKRATYHALSELVSNTHENEFRYRTAKNKFLYPWIDLHQNESGERELRSIYSGIPFPALELLINDLEIEQEMLGESLFTLGDHEIEERLDALEASKPFNCEHVVPQSWYGESEPMRGDLHHLFACESRCNSFRNNFPYFEFPDEAFREDCGRRDGVDPNKRFEPLKGKGPVARATLYFLLRYPGLIGDEAREFQRSGLSTIETWHTNNPPTIYELHRNAEIHRIQGNRNPLIDHPEWVSKISFREGFGTR